MEQFLHPQDFLRLFWRRKWWFLVPAAVFTTIAVAAVLLLPSIYRSEATILIEDQDVPEDLVTPLLDQSIDRRLDLLTRQVLSTSNLLELIERHGLYPEEAAQMPRAQLAERMRDAVDMEVLRTEVSDSGGGRSGEATVAFELAFDYRDPRAAQRVVSDLVSLYLSTNAAERRRAAAQANSFFESERGRIQSRIDNLEDELSTFRRANRDILPAEADFKRGVLADLERTVQNLDTTLRSLRERQSFLSTQLALTDEFEPVATAGSGTPTPATELEVRRAELATARARYSADHPDVRRLEREVRSLQAAVGSVAGGRAGALAERESALASELATLRERYTPEHPDVRRVERELASVRAAQGTAGDGDAGRRRSSTYVQLSSQLNSVETEIAAIETQRLELEEQRRRLEEQLARAPEVAQTLTRLQRELDAAVEDREQLAEKQTSVALSGSLETQAIGERLVIAAPATMPTDPARPNRKLLLVLGGILAVGGGAASATFREVTDRTIRSTAQLARIVGDSPLVAIPRLVSPAEKRRRRLLWLGGIVVVAAVVGGALWWFDQNVTPLVVQIYQIRRVIDGWLTATFPNLEPSVL
jgi:uncharacterized protein involved in exopolysaccharide biosynthesis